MKNREKYADEIIELSIKDGPMAVNNKGEIVSCRETLCRECLFSTGETCASCEEKKHKWLEKEYKKPEVDWAKVPVDTKVHVRNGAGREWIPRYFAGIEIGEPMVFIGGTTSFSCPRFCNGEACMECYDMIILAEDIKV